MAARLRFPSLYKSTTGTKGINIGSMAWICNNIHVELGAVITHTHPDFNSGLTLRWRHNDGDSVSNHQPHDCLLSCLFGRTSKKTSKLRVTGLCVGNSPGTGEFPAQMASNAENVSIWWRHHETAVETRAWMREIKIKMYLLIQVLISFNLWSYSPVSK